MMQPYPEPQEAWQNLEAEESMQAADHVIRAVRKLRSDYGLQRQRPQLFIQVHILCLAAREYSSCLTAFAVL